MISSASVAKNLGVWIDRSLMLEHQIHQVCKSAYKQIFIIYKICPLITQDAAHTLVQAFVTSKLYYGNALYFGISKPQLHKLQLIQNATASLVCGVRNYVHITQVVRALHWFPIQHRIEYKVVLLGFKAIQGLTPLYISDLLQFHRPARPLNFLEVPRTRCKTFGDHAFSAVAPRLWNIIPANLRAQNSILVFKKYLKTYLFRKAYQ